MTDEELEQQDKQEQKEERQEERKKTLKTVITSVICTLLFVVILLLLVILCLKNCSPRPNNNDSSSSSKPEPTWTEYDNPKLTNVFKEIVNTYLDFNMGDTKDLKDVLMVDYFDNKEETKFNLSICVTSNTEEKYVYYYEVENKSYAGFTDPFTFLLDEHTDLFLDEVAHFETYKELNTTVSSDKPNRYIVVSNLANTAKYFFGSYQDATNYQFHIYDKVEFNDGDNPLNTKGKVVDTSNLLYGYYRSVYQTA